MAAFLGVGLIMAVLLVASGILSGALRRFYFREGSTMSDGRHRVTTEDPYADLQGIENVEPWRATHHLYDMHAFNAAEDLFRFLASPDRPGRKEDWKISVPTAAQWKDGLKAEATPAQFSDFYLDSVLAKITAEG